MELTLHVTRRNTSRRFALGGARIVDLFSVKPDVLRPGIVGVRGSTVTRLRLRLMLSTLPPRPPLLTAPRL